MLSDVACASWPPPSSPVSLFPFASQSLRFSKIASLGHSGRHAAHAMHSFVIKSDILGLPPPVLMIGCDYSTPFYFMSNIFSRFIFRSLALFFGFFTFFLATFRFPSHPGVRRAPHSGAHRLLLSGRLE